MTVEDTPKVEPKPEAKVEPVVEVKPEPKDEPKVLTQADLDKVAGDVRRELRERTEALEKREKELAEREQDIALDGLVAATGVKKELLQKTGLTGDALKEFATDLAATLAESKPAPKAEEEELKQKTLTLTEALGSTTAAGVNLNNRTPMSLDEAMDFTLEEIA